MNPRAVVLVIDDEPGMRDMLAFELSPEGFEVETAPSGLAAVEAMKRRKFDLAITDLKMPGMDGVETVQVLREIDPDLEVIVATGYATVESAVACMKRGAYDYIQKPFDLGELKLLLGRALEKSHLQGVVALYEASRALLLTLRQDDLLPLVFDLARRVLRADAVGLLLERPDETGSDVYRSGDRTPSDALLRDIERLAHRAGSGLRLPSSADELASALRDEGFSSALAYPLRARHRLLGVLVVLGGPTLPGFSASELQRGSIFASQLALSLDNAHLHGDLAAKIDELTATREQLIQAEKLSLAGYLAGSVAHEINNPLTVVLAHLEALRDYSIMVNSLWLAARSAAGFLAERQDPEADALAVRLLAAGGGEERTASLVLDLTERIDELLESVRRMAELVAGFRSMSNPREVDPVQGVPVAEVVEECLASLPVLPEQLERGFTWEKRETVSAWMSPHDLRLALTHILTFICNRRSADLRDVPLVIRLGHRSGRPCLELADSKLILPGEEPSRIFDPRIRVDDRGGRTLRLDISLALAYHLLLRNQASLTATAMVDGGLTFVIVLPFRPS